uniref:Uncharacterized protein n=1 Tax=Globodera rostochiensis TaxID=31243 RepID=A0A914H460_GLORO
MDAKGTEESIFGSDDRWIRVVGGGVGRRARKERIGGGKRTSLEGTSKERGSEEASCVWSSFSSGGLLFGGV